MTNREMKKETVLKVLDKQYGTIVNHFLKNQPYSEKKMWHSLKLYGYLEKTIKNLLSFETIEIDEIFIYKIDMFLAIFSQYLNNVVRDSPRFPIQSYESAIMLSIKPFTRRLLNERIEQLKSKESTFLNEVIYQMELNNLTTSDCGRCGGSGYLPQYQHVQNGVCFACGGTSSLELSNLRDVNLNEYFNDAYDWDDYDFTI